MTAATNPVHLDEEQVQRLLHEELSPASEETVNAHLATCAACASLVARAREDEECAFSLLRHLDHDVPRVDAATVFSNARRRPPTWMRWAAGILLAAGVTGAAYAAPGSPLPSLVERAAEVLGGRHAPPPVPPPGSEDDPGQGLAVTPGDRFTIRFSTQPAGGSAIVSLAEGDELIVRAHGGSANFSSELDRLTITDRDASTTFAIEIPRRAAWVEVLVGERRVFLKERSHVLADSSAGAEAYVIPLAPRDP